MIQFINDIEKNHKKVYYTVFYQNAQKHAQRKLKSASLNMS